MGDRGFLTPDLVLVPLGTTPDGGVVFKTNVMELLAKNCVVPGMVAGDDD